MIFLYVLTLILGFLEASSTDRINQNNDRQIWSEEIFERDISGGWSYRARSVQNIGADYQRLFNHQYEGVLYCDLNKSYPSASFVKSMKLGAGYNATEHIQSNTLGVRQWVWFNRLLAENINTVSFFDWEISQRSRVEYHIYMRPYYEDHGVYRCRIQFNPPWEFTRFKIKPFLSNEWFFRRDTFDDDNGVGIVGGWYQNRLRLGIIFNPFSFYWQWRILKQPKGISPPWYNTYQLGVQIYL